MTERETINTLLEITKRDSSYLTAFEALGRTIEELKREVRSKELDIAHLKEELDIANKELAKVKGGRNEW